MAQETSEWSRVDACTWQRRIDGEYEMYGMRYIDYLDRPMWVAGGGTFSASEFDPADVLWACESFGVRQEDVGEDDIANYLFQCNMADFPLESFGTLLAAKAYIDGLTGDDTMGA